MTIMIGQPQARKLIIADRGLTLKDVARVVGPLDTALHRSVVFLDSPAPDASERTGIELVADRIDNKVARQNGENLASTAIALANRLASDLVDRMCKSNTWRSLLEYDGVSLNSVLYGMLAPHVFVFLRYFYVIRETVRVWQVDDVAFISRDPVTSRIFSLVAPEGKVIRLPNHTVRGLLPPWPRLVARFVRDVAVRSLHNGRVRWPRNDFTTQRVLFIAIDTRGCEARHPNVFEAVLREGMELAILCDPRMVGGTAFHHFFLADVPVDVRSQIRKWQHLFRFWQHRRELVELFRNQCSGSEIEPVFELLGIEAARYLLYYALYIILDLLETLKSAVARLGPDILFFEDSSMVGLCTGLAGRRCGIPTVWLQDGACGSEEPGRLAMEADRCASWGEATDRYLQKAGVDPRRVSVVGAPFMDAIATRQFMDRKQLGTELGLKLTGDERLISYMSAYTCHESWGPFAFSGNSFQQKRAILESICRAVQSVPGAKLIIKLHPSDPDRKFDYEIANSLLRPLQFQVTARQDLLHDILNLSDLVIVHDGSTTGVEAVALGKPLLSIDFDGIDGAGTSSWIREGVAVGVFSQDGMTDAVHAALFDESVRSELIACHASFLQRYAAYADGKNCTRFARVLGETIHDGPASGRKG